MISLHTEPSNDPRLATFDASGDYSLRFQTNEPVETHDKEGEDEFEEEGEYEEDDEFGEDEFDDEDDEDADWEDEDWEEELDGDDEDE